MSLPFSGFGQEIFAPPSTSSTSPHLDCSWNSRHRPAAIANWRRGILIAGLLLPCLLLQIVLVAICHRQLRTDNLLLSIAIPLVIMLLWARWLKRHLDVHLSIARVDMADSAGR